MALPRSSSGEKASTFPVSVVPCPTVAVDFSVKYEFPTVEFCILIFATVPVMSPAVACADGEFVTAIPKASMEMARAMAFFMGGHSLGQVVCENFSNCHVIRIFEGFLFWPSFRCGPGGIIVGD